MGDRALQHGQRDAVRPMRADEEAVDEGDIEAGFVAVDLVAGAACELADGKVAIGHDRTSVREAVRRDAWGENRPARMRQRRRSSARLLSRVVVAKSQAKRSWR